MEIKGEIISKHVDQLRINLTDKNQVIDVFYTESHKFDVEKLTVRQSIIFDVRIQSIDYYSLKLGKFWLYEIVFPARPPNKSSKHKKLEKNWAQDIVRENKFGEYPEEPLS